MSLYASHFYHGLLRKYTLAFGTLFSNINVVRYNEDGSEDHRQAVPLIYSNKEKYVQRIIADANLERQPAANLPRMAYEITSLQYNPERKLNKLNKLYFKNQTDETVGVYQPNSFDLMFNLYITTKTQDEVLQIVEQILPAFSPDYCIEVRGVSNPNISFDVPIALNGVQTSDSYEGSFEDRRVIFWTIGFTMKAYLFGPIRKSGLIKEVFVNVKSADIVNQRYFDLDVMPYIEGVALEDINKEDPWNLKVQITEYE